VSVQDIDLFIHAQQLRGLKPTTINRRLAAVISLYIFLQAEDDGLVCPVLPRRHMLRTPQALPRPVKQEDLQRFFQAIESVRDRAMFLLMLRCGLRIAEVAGLLLADLFLDEDPPRLVSRGKGSRERTAYLSPQAETALRAWLQERPQVSSDFVFLSYLEDGLSTTAIHLRLMRYRDLAGVSLTAHQLRHTFANDLIEADMPVTSIQKLLGHSWLERTQTYVQANDKQVQADFRVACLRLEGWS
jgi:site-specific recombinase XerD